jgi:hypothetical protein
MHLNVRCRQLNTRDLDFRYLGEMCAIEKISEEMRCCVLLGRRDCCLLNVDCEMLIPHRVASHLISSHFRLLSPRHTASKTHLKHICRGRRSTSDVDRLHPSLAHMAKSHI